MSEIQVQSVVEREFKPTKKQTEFLQVPWTVKEALYGGAAGSGKTEILVWMPLIYGFHEHPLYKGLTLRRTFPQLETEVIARSREIYPHFGGVYNESKKIWKFPSGAVERFGHADKEQDIRAYDSDQYNLVKFDEATHFSGFQYLYLSMSRVRSRCADLPAIIRSGTNPGNVGHSFFKKRFVSPHKGGGLILIDDVTKLKRIFIPARITDNEHLLLSNPDYVRQLESLSEAEKRAKLYGDWDTYEGQVFKEFRIEPLEDEPDTAQHVIKPIDIPLWWPRIIGIDWGWNAYTCMYWAAISPEGRVIIYREYAKKEVKTDDWIAELINLTGAEKEYVVDVRICHSADQHRGEPFTVLDRLNKGIKNNGFNCRASLGERNRLNGKLAIHEYLRWTPKESIAKYYTSQFDEKYAQKIFRLYGNEAYLQYINLYVEQPVEDNLPKLLIFNTCPLLIETLPACIYEEQKERDKPPEDVAEFDGDDPYDCLRILLSGIKTWILEKAKAYAEIQSTNIAIKALSTGDTTSFYRQMEKLDAKKQEEGYSIRRRGFSRFGGRRAS